MLVRKTAGLIAGEQLSLVNADITIVAQTPRLAPYVEAMCANISADLQVMPGQVNIKATTTEHLGFTGRNEGIAAFAVVLLEN